MMFDKIPYTILAPQKGDRRKYKNTFGCIGRVKAYYSKPDNLMCFKTIGDSVINYIAESGRFLDFLKGYFPDEKSLKRHCNAEHRLISREPVPAYGFHFKGELSVYVKVTDYSDFDIMFYMN